MRVMAGIVLVFGVLGVVGGAVTGTTACRETRLTVHTLLREDLFAGFMANDMVRFARGERNVEQLLKDRPDQRGNVLAWKGLAAMHRAVLAHDAGNTDEFLKQLQASRAAFAEAAKQTSGNEGVGRDHRRHLFSVRRSPAGAAPRRRHGQTRMRPTRCCGNSRARRSTSSPCITAAKCSAASCNRRSAPAAPRRWRSISTACSRSCRARRTRRRRSSGKRIRRVQRRRK